MTEGIDEYFVIPADYVSTGAITRYTMAKELEVAGATQFAMRVFLQNNLLEGRTSPEIAERVKAPMFLKTVRLDEEGEEVSVDQETGDRRENDAYYQASRAYEQHLISCLGELIRLDSATPSTQPHRWETPPSQRWWVPRRHR